MARLRQARPDVTLQRRRFMTNKAILLAAFFLGFNGGPAQARDEKPRPAAPVNADPALVKRGEYLINQVAHCGECHTPRDARGRLDLGRHLQGAKMWFTPR